MLQLAQPSDREAINLLALQVHAMHVQWRPDIYEMPEELFSEKRLLEAIQNRGIYVAKIDDVVIGYVLLKTRLYDWAGVVKRKVMYIDELCVHELYRNQGIGRTIMQDVQALAKAFRCTDMQLGVYPQNNDAVAFYQKCGFTIRSIDMQRKV